MQITIFPITTPIITINLNDDFFSPQSDKSNEIKPPVSQFSNTHPYLVSRLRFQKDLRSTTPMQSTSVKVHGVHFTWKANMGSPRKLNDYINELEQGEQRRVDGPRQIILDDIQQARTLVTQTSNTFDNIQDYVQKFSKIRNELRLQNPSENISDLLKLNDAILNDLASLTLPAELTQENLEAYEKKAKDLLQICESKFSLFEKAVIGESKPEDIKTQAQAAAVFNESAAVDKEESAIGPEVAKESVQEANDQSITKN